MQSSERDFPEKSGRHPNERLGESAHDIPGGAFISRRVIARQLRPLVIRCRRRCDRRCHYRIRSREIAWMATFPRNSPGFCSRLQLPDKRGTIDFPRVFFAVSMPAIVERRACCTLEFPEWSFVTKFISNNAFIRCGFLASMCDTLQQHFSNYLSSSRSKSI